MVVYQNIESFNPHLPLDITQCIQQISPLTGLEYERKHKWLFTVILHDALFLYLSGVINRYDIPERDQLVIFVVICCLLCFLYQTYTFFKINHEPSFGMG